jgi:RNA polymerase sigma-70 factor (ECF subfamily)
MTRAAAGGDDDVALVRRAKRGDVGAFSELVQRHQRPLMAKALGSTRNVADADDLVQETFLRAWREMGRLRDDTRFGPWLHRVLGNLLVDRGRREGRELGEPEGGFEGTPSCEADPEATVLARELARGLEHALKTIPEGRQREVFRLRYVDGLAIQEIAAKLGVHSGTVKVHLFRTARRLRALLAGPEAAR